MSYAANYVEPLTAADALTILRNARDNAAGASRPEANRLIYDAIKWATRRAREPGSDSRVADALPRSARETYWTVPAVNRLIQQIETATGEKEAA